MHARVSYEKIELGKSDHSPWSVYGISVKTQRLNICFHLSLDKNQFHADIQWVPNAII